MPLTFRSKAPISIPLAWKSDEPGICKSLLSGAVTWICSLFSPLSLRLLPLMIGETGRSTIVCGKRQGYRPLDFRVCRGWRNLSIPKSDGSGPATGALAARSPFCPYVFLCECHFVKLSFLPPQNRVFRTCRHTWGKETILARLQKPFVPLPPRFLLTSCTAI